MELRKALHGLGNWERPDERHRRSSRDDVRTGGTQNYIGIIEFICNIRTQCSRAEVRDTLYDSPFST